MPRYIPLMAVFATTAFLLLTLSTSTPLEPRVLTSNPTATSSLDARQDLPLPACYVGHTCPGLTYDPGSCNTASDVSTVSNAILDASYLAQAALNALNSNSGSPAAHYYDFFSNNASIVGFVKDIYTSVVGCATQHTCPFSLVFCSDGYQRCAGNSGLYAYAPHAAYNSQELDGGDFFMCPAGMALSRNPVPCSTAGGQPSLGYALIRALVQITTITNADEPLLMSTTGQEDITDKSATISNIAALGWGTNGDGLGVKGVGNADNYAQFATWSWDLGYGSAPWTGGTCQSKWDDFVSANNIIPVS